MKIAFYCQHVLGVGHFHRSLELCRGLAKEHQVTLILGGPDLDFDASSLEIFKLPGLEMDQDFQNLQPCNPSYSLEEVKAKRAEELIALFKAHQFEVFITELYPFGRKAFRFELDPLLQAIKDKEVRNCKVYCSLRDILVERKEDTEKFESRVIRKLNRYFHGILIHSDQRYIPLEKTFSQFDNISQPICYTGFVSRTPPTTRTPFTENKKLIVASIGGGNVGGELLLAVAEAFKFLQTKRDDLFLQIFTGLYSPSSLTEQLVTFRTDDLVISPFTENFQTWIQKAALSISMAGYNSCMDVIASGTPALLYPFNQNQEQRLRVDCLKQAAPIHLLEQEDLQPQNLAILIEQALLHMAQPNTISLNGTQKTVQQINEWSGK